MDNLTPEQVALIWKGLAAVFTAGGGGAFVWAIKAALRAERKDLEDTLAKACETIETLKKAIGDQGGLLAATNANVKELTFKLVDVDKNQAVLASNLEHTHRAIEKHATLYEKVLAVHGEIRAIDPRVQRLETNFQRVLDGLKNLRKTGTDSK